VDLPNRLPELLGPTPGKLQGHLGQDQNELLATVAARDIAFAHPCHEQAPQLAQQRIAGVVPAGVVERLE